MHKHKYYQVNCPDLVVLSSLEEARNLMDTINEALGNHSENKLTDKAVIYSVDDSDTGSQGENFVRIF